MDQNENTPDETGLTGAQRREVIELLNGYFGIEEAARRAQDAAARMLKTYIEEGITSKIMDLVKESPEKAVAALFNHSGMIVRTEASKAFDEIICTMLRDEGNGIPEAIRQYLRDHLPELIQRAVSEIVATMVIDFLKNGASEAAIANAQLIRAAFMSARIQPGY